MRSLYTVLKQFISQERTLWLDGLVFIHFAKLVTAAALLNKCKNGLIQIHRGPRVRMKLIMRRNYKDAFCFYLAWSRSEQRSLAEQTAVSN